MSIDLNEAIASAVKDQKQQRRLDKARQTAANLRTGMSTASVVADQFRRDTERVLSYLDEHGSIFTTYGTASPFYGESIYHRLPVILQYLEVCGIAYPAVTRGTGTTWRKVKPA
jgi:hypothetical protein